VITQWDNVLPTLKQGSIAPCYTSLAAATNAALAATTTGTAGCSGSLTFKLSYLGTCPTAITVTGTDGCGNSASVSYSTKILTAPPTLIGRPANTNVQCVGQIPPCVLVTAVDSCGTALTVSSNQIQSNPGSTCSNVITRTWSATDCANQTTTCSQVITQWDNVLPTLKQGSIAPCYTSLAAATNAALAATTTGTAGCSGSLTFKLSYLGTCPTAITVTGTDGCGNSASVSYSTKILTAPPTMFGCPVNTNVQCASEIPAPATVTAADSCGTALTVIPYQTESNPNSTCSNVITRTWSATDCAGQVVNCTQVITQWNNVASTLTCPSNVTIVTNFCQMYCTFSPGDWSGACDGGSHYNNNWWQNWCGQNSTSQCWSSWTGWWSSCGANSTQCNNWWGNWNNNRPTTCWGSWSGGQNGNQSGNWWNSWNNGNYGSQNWVPCGGNNPDTILNNCFKQVYSNSCVTIGLRGSGKCVTATSCSAVQTCLNIGGNPGVLTGCATNPASCAAGSFCAQVLALQLNCDFGDYGCVPGFVGKCGDLVLCDSTSPCNGKKVRDILSICNCALGGGTCPQGCTVQYLCGLCTNLNQCFEGCQVSSWCGTHLCSVYIPLPAQTGTATVTQECGESATLTYCDTVSTGSCTGTYEISRQWTAVDACGNTNTCAQLITISQSSSCGLSGLVVLACSGDSNLSNNEGLANVTVTLESSTGTVIATTTTGANGSYSFGNVAPGSYLVLVTPPKGYTETYPAGSGNESAVTLTPCQSQSGVNFSYTGSTPAVQLIKTGPCMVPCSGVITYTFAVTNTGNTCETLSVVDPLLGGTIFSQTSVAPGQGFLFTSNYTVGSTTCSLTNTAWAIGTPPTGTPVTSTSIVVTAVCTKCVTNQICGSFNSQNPGGGYVWCNAHLTCNPGKACTVYCQNATVTLSCNDGKTYTFPVPDCQVNFSPNCSSGTCSFNGISWATTLPCAGDSQIFLSGCGIPWQSDFANCKSVCWTGSFSCSTSGINCSWQWGAACYNNNLGNCGSINVKACQQTSCGYNNNDYAGTPENCKSSCQGGGCGTGGNNYCGSWSSTGSFTCK
jgi:uncharacterized repeat protein (TIGR01451 family)